MTNILTEAEYDGGYANAWETAGKRPADFLEYSRDWRMGWTDGADDFTAERLTQARMRRSSLLR